MKQHEKRIVHQRINRYLLTAIVIIFPLYIFSQDDGEVKTVSTNGSQYPAYDTFDTILDRNIFNPNRRPRQEEIRPVERTPDPDEIVLTGTIVTEKDCFAFFEDSRSGDMTVVTTGKSFLGFEVNSVDTDTVILKKADQLYEVTVLMALQKEEGSDWEINTPNRFDRSTSTSSSNSSFSNSSENESSNDSSGSGDVQNEVLRKLLEKRRQESAQ